MRKLSTKLNKINNLLMPLSFALVFGCMLFVPGFNVFADGATTMINGVISMATKVALVLGVVIGIFGFISYLAANSEGDGPAKHKAQQQIAAAIMLVIGGVILNMVPWASIIAG